MRSNKQGGARWALVAGAFCLLAPVAAKAMSFKPSVLLDARGDFESESSAGNPVMDGAFNGQLFLVPGLTFGQDMSLLPLLGVIASGRSVSIPEESAFTQTYNVIGRPQFRKVLDGGWGLDLYGVASHAYNQQTTTEVLGTDFYDHEEYGLGGGFEWKGDGPGLRRWQIDGQILRRHYPNWHEQLTNITQDLNYYSKDYWGPKFSTSFAGGGAASAWNLELDWQHKRFADSLLLAQDGTFTLGTQREDDWLHGEGGYQRVWGAWTGGLNLTLDAYLSNQGFFDALTYVGDYYGYDSVQAGPSLTWKPLGKPGASFTLSASWVNRTYTGRLIRNFDGSFAEGKEADFEQHYDLAANWPLWGRLALVGGIGDAVVQSNQQFAYQYQPTYSLLSANLGIHYQY